MYVACLYMNTTALAQAAVHAFSQAIPILKKSLLSVVLPFLLNFVFFVFACVNIVEIKDATQLWKTSCTRAQKAVGA